MARLRRKSNEGSRAPTGRGRKWTFRITAMVLSPLLFFACLEGLLRLFGYGYPTAFFLPRTINGQKVFIENGRFCWRFLGPALSRTPHQTILPAIKPPDTIRIFVFGESAAYGDPHPEVSLSRVLATLMNERYPGARFEVVNTGVVAINSNVILPIARDCAKRDGDIWVVYMGNNEVVGPFGSGTVFGPHVASLPVIRGSIALKGTRTGELLTDFLGRFGARQDRPGEWGGMMMFMRHQVRQDDPRMASVYSHFERNLTDMVQAGIDCGAKIVLSTVGSNVKDCAPFASLHRPGLTEAQTREWDGYYSAGVEAEQGGNQARAVEHYRNAGQVDDRYADLQFRWARSLLALGREDEARQHYVLARDYDVLRFRADTRINEIIRGAAAEREKEGVLLADAVTALAGESPHGLAGEEFFHEHVHLNFEGNYLLARTVADQVARLLPESVRQRARTEWLPARECARQLAWTDWNRYRTLQKVANDIGVPPFVHQLDNSGRQRQMREKLAQLSPVLSPESLREAATVYQQALAKAPVDWVLHKSMAELRQQMGDLAGAAESWREVAKLIPHDGGARLQLGLALARQGRTDEAVMQFEAMFDVDPVYAQANFAKVLNTFATTLADQGRYEPAIEFYRQALQFKPDFSPAHMNLGTTLIAAGRTNEGREHLRMALKHRPATPQGLVTLGKACHAQGWDAEAVAILTEALRLRPSDVSAHFWLGEALVGTGRFAEAGEHYAEAVRLQPDYADAHLKWGVSLLRQNKDGEALRHFQEVLRLNPDDITAQQHIKAIRGREGGGF